MLLLESQEIKDKGSYGFQFISLTPCSLWKCLKKIPLLFSSLVQSKNSITEFSPPAKKISLLFGDQSALIYLLFESPWNSYRYSKGFLMSYKYNSPSEPPNKTKNSDSQLKSKHNNSEHPDWIVI